MSFHQVKLDPNRMGTRAGKIAEAYEVRAVSRALEILDFLHGAEGGASLAEVAHATQLPRSSAFRYLATLEARGYVERDGAEGRYRLGIALPGLRARHLEALAARARPYLEELRDRFHETINLGVLDGGRVAYVEIVESPLAMRFAARRGDRDPLHSTALGKALAAQLGVEQIRRILAAEGMPQLTSRTITDPDRFLREVDEVRSRGFAIDNGENEEGGRCVGVPVVGSRVPAAISLSAPAMRFSLERAEEAARELRHAATRLGAELEAGDA